MTTCLRIGILCVHGIGNQKEDQHVSSVVRNFRRAVINEFGSDNVFVDVDPGVRISGRVPFASITIIRGDAGSVRFDFFECYWRDIGAGGGLLNLVRFWWWALTLWATEGFSVPCVAGRRKREKGGVGGVERARLLFYSLAFFVLLLPVRFVFIVLSWFPFLGKIDVLSVAYAYMSSVKLYQENPSRTKAENILDDLGSRRIWIQKRFVNNVIDMTSTGCDRWFVLAHSLGSVVTYKGLSLGAHSFSRLIDWNRWVQIPDKYKVGNLTHPEGHVDCPPRPVWLPPSGGLDLAAVYQRFGGVICYGSPLETFARLWPSLLESDERLPHLNNKVWLNLYDVRDFISSPLAVDGFLDGMNLINCEVDSHYLITSSHTSYLRAANSNKELAAAVYKLMINGDSGDLESISAGLKRSKISNVMSLIFQSFCILMVGFLSLPVVINIAKILFYQPLSFFLNFMLPRSLAADIVWMANEWLMQSAKMAFQSPLNYLAEAFIDVFYIAFILFWCGVIRWAR